MSETPLQKAVRASLVELTTPGRRCRKCSVTYDSQKVKGGIQEVPVCFCGAETVPVKVTVRYLEAEKGG